MKLKIGLAALLAIGAISLAFWFSTPSTEAAGHLQIVESINISNSSPITSDWVKIRFGIRNTGDRYIDVQELAAGARRGTDWSGQWADFDHTGSFRLNPGQTYYYEKWKQFSATGAYFAEPVVRINNSWGGIPAYGRVWFTVRAAPNPGKLQIVEPLRLSNTNPRQGDWVEATLKVKNVGGQGMAIDQFAVGARRGNDWSGENVDFPSVFGWYLQPGEVKEYRQSRQFSTTGGYFAESVAKIGGSWGGVPNFNRVWFNVQPGPGRLVITEAIALNKTSAPQGENIAVWFRIKNVGGQSIYVEEIAAAARLGNDWSGKWADFPHKSGFWLAPNAVYLYEAYRSFDDTGSYFAEPAVKIAGNWGGIPEYKRTYFNVALGPGRLMVSEAVALNKTSAQQGENIAVWFRIKNVGGQSIYVEEVTAGARLGNDWSGKWADFPHKSGFWLAPNAVYLYEAYRSFDDTGSYFAEASAKVNGAWQIIAGTNRVTYTITPGAGKPVMVNALSLSSTTPSKAETVTASFRIKNNGGQNLKIEQLVAAARFGSNWDAANVDFPSVFNITLAPGAEYTYQQSRQFNEAGNYFSEPAVKISGSWQGISGSNRVNFVVNSATTRKALAVPYVNQVTAQRQIAPDTRAGDTWYLCGPSSTAMVLAKYGKANNPTYDAAHVLRQEVLKDPEKDQETSWPKMSKALSDRGVNNSGALGKLSFEEIIAEIDAGHPVIMGFTYWNQWNPKGVGHITVIVGYEKSDRSLIVNDPFGPWGWWNDFNHLANSVTNQDGGIYQRYPYDSLNNNTNNALLGNMMKTWN